MRYLNWRGEMRWRRVLPHAWRVGETEWHKGPQWLMSATDLEDCKIKEFAMNGVFGWEIASDQSLPWRVTAAEEYPDACHPSHVTRPSDASSFDEICINCGARDSAGGGWGSLRYPCKPKTKGETK
jgi:hypothetical protein